MPQPEIVPAIASRARSGWALHGICTRMGAAMCLPHRDPRAEPGR